MKDWKSRLARIEHFGGLTASHAFFQVAMLLAIFCPSFAWSDTAGVSFNSSASIDSSTAVLNIQAGYLHPRLMISQLNDGSGNRDLVYDVGDGRHGSFNENTYLSFHDGVYAGDHIIRINTDTYPDLYFTDFTLGSAWTIQPVGSKPLKIHSLSTINIYGKIKCDGEPGASLNPDNTQTSAGGAGRCGGGNGGRGGSTALVATSGEVSTHAAIGTTPEGGQSGSVQGAGGGGGGAFNNGPAGVGKTDNEAADDRLGATVLDRSDNGFVDESGGSGGGGGEHAGDSSGGGGGAGGGSIYLYAVSGILVDAGAEVTADGGDGGGSVGAGEGGGGGGGGGGSISMFTLGEADITGVISAVGGAGAATDGGNGGTGSEGRVWITDEDGMPTGVFPFSTPAVLILIPGIVTYEVAQFTVVSKLIDLGNRTPQLNSLAVDADVPAGSAVSLEVAASDVPFAAAGATWVPEGSIAQANGKRYVRLRITVDSQSSSDPVLIRGISIDFTPGNIDKFEFTSCALTNAPPPEMPLGPQLLLLMLPLGLALGMRFKNSSVA